MRVLFNESVLPEEISKNLRSMNYAIGASFIENIARVLFVGVSHFLSDTKNTDVPQALVFSQMDGKFICAAYVKCVKDDNGEGVWDYSWTFDESYIDENANKINFATTQYVFPYLDQYGIKLYNFMHNDSSTATLMYRVIIESISKYLDENASDEEFELVIEGACIASCVKEGETVLKSIIPDEEIREIIKGDDMLSNNN